MDRRTFLKAALGGTGMALGAGQLARAADLTNIALPSIGQVLNPAKTPVEHIVVLMMENRSIDHYLGWYGAENDDFDATQTGVFPSRPDPVTGEVTMVPTSNWGGAGRGNYHGRGFADPSHGWGGGRDERNGGACDGWLRAGSNDEFAISYYDAADLPVWSQLVRGWQAYDRWFCSVLGPTQPNRFYLHSAQSGGRKDNDLPPQVAQETGDPKYAHGWDWPTIWTLLEQKGITAAYYYCNLPEILYWGERHIAHARHVSEYYAAAEAGGLPQVSFIDPWFIGPEGVSNDDHPHADLRLGQAFISDVVEAFVNSPVYRKGALVVTYDEWGGFWDHVDPPRLPDDLATDADPGGENDFGQLGFRIPSTIVSPWTAKKPTGRGNRVDHRVYDHTSIIKFIADNWGLGYLNTRHAATNSIESAFRHFREYQPEPQFTPYDLSPELLLQLTTAPYTEQAGASPAAQSDLHRLADIGWFDGRSIRTDYRFEDSFRRSGIRIG